MELNEEMFLTNYGCVCPKYKKGLPVCRSSAMCPTASAEWNAIRVASAQAQAANGLVNAMHDGVTEVRTNLMDVTNSIGLVIQAMDKGFGELAMRVDALSEAFGGVAPAIEELDQGMRDAIESLGQIVEELAQTIKPDKSPSDIARAVSATLAAEKADATQKVVVNVTPSGVGPLDNAVKHETIEDVLRYWNDLRDPKKVVHWRGIAADMHRSITNLRADMLGQIPGVAGIRVTGELARLDARVTEMRASLAEGAAVTDAACTLLQDRAQRECFARDLKNAADYLEATREKRSPESVEYLGKIRSVATYLKHMRDATKYEAARMDIAEVLTNNEWGSHSLPDACGSCGNLRDHGHTASCAWQELANRLGIKSNV